MSHASICLVVLACVIVLFVANRTPVEIVALGSAVALYVTGVLPAAEITAGFGDPVVMFVAALFVVSTALEVSGATAWAGRRLVARAGAGQRRLLGATLVFGAVLTALITVNGAVAALLPMVVMLAVRTGLPPSRMAMPLAFAGHAGSLLLLTGTPINVLVSEAAEHAGGRGFGFAEFALVGVPLVVGTIVIAVVFGDRLLPRRTPATLPPDLSRHADTLAAHYSLDDETLVDEETGIAEVVVRPRSELVGRRLYPGMATGDGDLVILAVHRKGRPSGPPAVPLAPGDILLLQGAWPDLRRVVARSTSVLAVDEPADVQQQVDVFGRRARLAVAVLGAMVVLLAVGAPPPAVTVLLAASAMVLLRVLSVGEAYDGISWTTVVLVGGMFPLSVAIRESGLADQIARGVVSAAGGHTHLLLAGIFLLTALLGQVISNMATALIIIPIAVAAASDAHVSPRPLLMAVAIAAAASFLTPVATAANMMVMDPGGYRFGDYRRLGLPILAWFLVVTMAMVPLIWRF